MSLLENLEALRKHIETWAKGVQGHRRKKKRELFEQLVNLNEEDPDESILANITEVKMTLNMKADKEELYWTQRARFNWIRLGDRNTSYFQQVATQKRKKKLVLALEDDNGELVEGGDNLTNLESRYFYDLFASKNVQNSASLMDQIEPCIQPYCNIKLMEFTVKKFLKQLKRLASSKL